MEEGKDISFLCPLADGARENMLMFGRRDVLWKVLGVGGVYESGFGAGSICLREG